MFTLVGRRQVGVGRFRTRAQQALGVGCKFQGWAGPILDIVRREVQILELKSIDCNNAFSTFEKPESKGSEGCLPK